jgi:hypothetical protein
MKNKKEISGTDILEWIKITLVLFIGFILIKLIFFDYSQHITKCACDCANVIRLG